MLGIVSVVLFNHSAVATLFHVYALIRDITYSTDAHFHAVGLFIVCTKLPNLVLEMGPLSYCHHGLCRDFHQNPGAPIFICQEAPPASCLWRERIHFHSVCIFPQFCQCISHLMVSSLNISHLCYCDSVEITDNGQQFGNPREQGYNMCANSRHVNDNTGIHMLQIPTMCCFVHNVTCPLCYQSAVT